MLSHTWNGKKQNIRDEIKAVLLSKQNSTTLQKNTSAKAVKTRLTTVAAVKRSLIKSIENPLIQKCGVSHTPEDISGL